ncbi:hypothetical protein CNMCM5793_002336 [Aspergillus hiratsukae]|uniref:Uncharacterized protein n=1 Tax=Aspergillus hiratsukae TaxID=1194566 RepID=A0A8H6UGK1_9EURO|nr:hypothetical protein CNMCM5793_002336 [Aspergillus hiratsukae]KAF7169083.1 hypothetical protein CNMCM6106_004040 [Aspergillus hiratsukae]
MECSSQEKWRRQLEDEQEFLLLKAICLQAKTTDRWRVQTEFGVEHVRFSYFAHIERLMVKVIGTPPARQKEQEKDDKQKLIPLAPRSSDHAKRTCWAPAGLGLQDTGVTMRARVMGEPVYRRLVLEITYRKADNPSKTIVADVLFDNDLHVTDYDVEDRVVRKKHGRKHKHNRPVDTSDESNEQKEDSYWILKFVAKGCTAFGMDIDYTGFDNASADVFWYLRTLTSKLKAGEKTQVMIHQIRNGLQRLLIQLLRYKSRCTSSNN